MKAPRLTAAIFVIICIAVLSLAAIGLVQWGGYVAAHGEMVEHQSGTIIAMDGGKSFTLRTKGNQLIHFQCTSRCQVQWQHMDRHRIEKASTDVYYIEDMQHGLIAIDVD